MPDRASASDRDLEPRRPFGGFGRAQASEVAAALREIPGLTGTGLTFDELSALSVL